MVLALSEGFVHVGIVKQLKELHLRPKHPPIKYGYHYNFKITNY
jgi:hypothetical protein